MMFKDIISSQDNPKFNNFKKLLSSKGIKKQSCFLLSGEKILQEQSTFIKSNGIEWLTCKEHSEHDLLQAHPLKVSYFEKELFNQLDVIGTKAPLAVCKTPVYKTWSEDQLADLVLVVALGDPGNLGAVIRSAVAFGVKKLILLEEAANTFLPKSLKAAAGGNFQLEIFNGPSIQDISSLTPLFALDAKGTDLKSASLPESFYLLAGEEGPGLPDNLQAQKLSICIQNMESLNANVATSICLYELSTRAK